MEEMNYKEGFIVTRNQNEAIETPSGKITILPAWKFLLDVEKN